MENILVTGAAGFIGCKTAQILLEQGYNIIGIDNLNDYYDVRIKYFRLDLLKIYPNFRFYKIDIEDINSIRELFKNNNITAIINLAARAGVGYSMINPFVYYTTNTLGTLNLLEIMNEFSIKKFILASTSSLYAGQSMPFNEDLPVNTPISQYAASKKAAEATCYTYHYLYDLDITILRYFTVYGPAGRPDMSIFRFIKWIDEDTPIELFGDGNQARDFTYIDDIANGTVNALQHKGFDIINLGGGQNPFTINYMIHKIELLLNKKANYNKKPFLKTDILETFADINKAKIKLNWYPKISFDTGLEKTVNWYNENKIWLKNIVV